MKITRRSLLLSTAAAAGTAAQEPRPLAQEKLEKLRKAKKRPAEPKPAAPSEPGRSLTGDALREIAFPLGGIGTGTVSLGGCGQFRDWEIFNRPAKGSLLPFTFVAARFAGGGLDKPKVRVLERQPFPPYTAIGGNNGIYPRETAAGFPRFREAVFTGAYPVANVELQDPKLPVKVSIEAFNPMTPLETDDSSLPAAILTYRFHSKAPSTMDLSVAFSIMNPIGHDGVGTLIRRASPLFGQNLNEFRRDGNCAGLFLSSKKYGAGTPDFGTMAVTTEDGDITYRAEWQHGGWWDELQKWWDEFLGQGRFPNQASKPSEDGSTEYASIASNFTLAPGESHKVTFVLAWHFPVRKNYWVRDQAEPTTLKNQYALRWGSAWEPACYALKNLSSLRSRSLEYRDTLFGSTLPPAVLDAVSSQASILRTNTIMVVEGNQVLGFEGCDDNSGCCAMNCTHVYNYEQAMAFLYPELERSMRNIDFSWNMRPDGAMSFRTPVPYHQGSNDFRPAADGQMGTVMKVYREWLLGGSDEWLKTLWPQVKRALEYAWKQWDANRDGLMEGEQHNTYDIEFYGPNSMTGLLYLGALAAGAEMARHLGDPEAAQTYDRLRQKGSEGLDTLLFNGEYYVQKVDETKPQAKRNQYGDGCLADQVLGQWFAEVVGLGHLVSRDHVRSALSSIVKYNFIEDFSEFENAQRIYALNDDKGLLLCSWPKDKRPAVPFPYSDEVWTGIEYQVAGHLIYEGFVREGVAIVQAARDRYDGVRRNPWDEIECGHHYARAMSSWALLTAFSGFGFSAPQKELRFNPRTEGETFRALFSNGVSWGRYSQETSAAARKSVVEVKGGRLALATLRLPWKGAKPKVTSKAPANVEISGQEAVVRFATPLLLSPGESIEVTLSAEA